MFFYHSYSMGYSPIVFPCCCKLFTRFWAFFQIDFLGQAKSPNIWGVFWPVLRNLTKKVRWVWFWEFSVKLKPCYVMLIPTLRATLRQLFLGMVKIALYLHGSYFPREHSKQWRRTKERRKKKKTRRRIISYFFPIKFCKLSFSKDKGGKYSFKYLLIHQAFLSWWSSGANLYS